MLIGGQLYPVDLELFRSQRLLPPWLTLRSPLSNRSSDANLHRENA